MQRTISTLIERGVEDETAVYPEEGPALSSPGRLRHPTALMGGMGIPARSIRRSVVRRILQSGETAQQSYLVYWDVRDGRRVTTVLNTDRYESTYRSTMIVRLCCHWNHIMVSANRGSLFGGSSSAVLNAPTLRRMLEQLEHVILQPSTCRPVYSHK